MAHHHRHRYDAWNFPSSYLLAAPQWRNALAEAAVVVMLSFKRAGGRIKFHVFLLVTVTLTRWPSYTNLIRPEDLSDWAKKHFVRQGFRKYWQTDKDTQTDRQTDTTERITRRFAGGNRRQVCIVSPSIFCSSIRRKTCRLVIS